MTFFERIAWKLLRLLGYKTLDIYDSWQVVLADNTASDSETLDYRLFRYLMHSRLQALLTSLRIDLVVDVGAHVGNFGQSIRRHGFGGQILSCEPNPSAYQQLISVSQPDAKWHVEHLAVAEERSERNLHVAADTSFSSFCTRNSYSERTFGALP